MDPFFVFFFADRFIPLVFGQSTFICKGIRIRRRNSFSRIKVIVIIENVFLVHNSLVIDIQWLFLLLGRIGFPLIEEFYEFSFRQNTKLCKR